MKNWDFKISLFLFFALDFAAAGLVCAWASDSPASNADGWEKTGETEGILTYRKQLPNTPIVTFKGEGVIDAPIETVANIVLDTSRAKEWADSLEESRIVSMKSAFDFIEYDHVRTPIVMKDREFVSHVTIQIDASTKTMTVLYSSAPPDAAPPTSHVRGDLAGSVYRMTPVEGGKKTLLSGEMYCDPKGSVPKWIINLFQKSWPRNTLLAIRRQAKKTDIQTLPEFAELFKRLRAVF